MKTDEGFKKFLTRALEPEATIGVMNEEYKVKLW